MSSKRNDPFSRFLVIGIASAVALAVLAILIFSNRPRQGDQDFLNLLEEIPHGVVEQSGLPYLGDPDAPVTMLIYEDLGCPNCRNFYLSVEPNVIEDFVVNGDVKIVVYTLAFVNAQSLPAAEALACALDQDKYWELRDVLFHNQGVQQYNRQNLIAFAEDVGIDRETFSACFDLGEHTQRIIQQSQTAYDFGITGTPTTEIAGVRYVGVVPYERDDPPGIRLIIEAALLQLRGN